MTRRGQAGEGQFGCIVALIILLAAVFVAYKMIPIKVKAADLRQTITDEAKSASTHRESKIMSIILDKAKDLELPVTEDNVKIQIGNERIKIDVDYVVPVQFPGYVYQWHFHHHAENPIF